MTTYRIFFIQHTLSAAEEAKLIAYRQNRSASDGQIQITYRKKRQIVEVEAESVGDAVTAISEVREEIPGLEGVYRSYRTVFAAMEAQYGESCKALEDSFMAEEVELPLLP